MRKDLRMALGNIHKMNLLKEFRPKAKDGNISAAIAVTLAASGVVESWKVGTNSKDMLEVLIPSSKCAWIGNYNISFSIKPSEIPWTMDSFKSQFISIKDALANGKAAILSNETGEQVYTDSSYNMWMTDCSLYFSLSVNAEGSALVLQAFYLQDMLETMKADPPQDGDYCPGELLYSVPVEAKFVMTPDYHGPRLTFFTNNVKAVRNIIETNPGTVARSCNTLLQKIGGHQFLLEKKLNRRTRSDQGDFTRFAISEENYKASLFPHASRASQYTDVEEDHQGQSGVCIKSRILYIWSVLKVLLVIVDTVSDMANGIQLLVVYKDYSTKYDGSYLLFYSGIGILSVLLLPGLIFGAREEGNVLHKIKSALFWMLMFPFVIILKGLGSVLPYISHEVSSKSKEEFMFMKSYECVFEAGIQVVLNMYIIFYKYGIGGQVTAICLTSLMCSFISVYTGCYEIWREKGEKGVCILGKILIFLTIPDSLLVAVSSLRSMSMVNELITRDIRGRTHGFSSKLQFMLIFVHCILFLTRIPVLLNLTRKRSKLVNKVRPNENGMNSGFEICLYIWQIVTSVMMNLDDKWTKIGYVIFKVIPNLWLLIANIIGISTYMTTFIQERRKLLEICFMAGFITMRFLLTILSSFYVLKPSMYIKPRTLVGLYTVDNCAK